MDEELFENKWFFNCKTYLSNITGLINNVKRKVIRKNKKYKTFVFKLILIIKNIIIKPIIVLRNAALSPDKKITSTHRPIVKILNLFNNFSLLK